MTYVKISNVSNYRSSVYNIFKSVIYQSFISLMFVYSLNYCYMFVGSKISDVHESKIY